MKNIAQTEFDAIMDCHEKWLDGEAGGQKAFFSNVYGVGIVARNRRFVDSRFVGSSFVRSRFIGSSFVGSRFIDSSFVGSRFIDSSFDGSSFDGSRFIDSRFIDSSFDGSSFDGSSFDDSTFATLNFESAKNDFFATLLYLPQEVSVLKNALLEGRLDGSQYEGECACLKGTLEQAATKDAEQIGWKHDANLPAETFFLSISKGDTPETSRFSALAVQWIEEFYELPLVKMAGLLPKATKK